MPALSFEASIQDAKFLKRLDNMERRTMGFTNTVIQEGKKVDDSFSSLGSSLKTLGTFAAGAFAFRGLAELPQELFKVRGEFQQLEISFTTMLRSKEKADKLFSDIRGYALTSPSSVKESADVVKQLLAYGSAAETVIGEVRMLGDVAAGTSQPLSEIAYLYGTLKTQGRAYAQDIRQFAGRGIAIYSELAKVLKINTNEVNDFVSAGKVGFKEVEQAFKNMTSGQGVFAGLTEAQNKSLVGLTSQLGDAWEAALNDIGRQNEGLAGDVIKGTTAIVQNYKQVVDVLQVISAAYGTYKAAQLLASVAQLQNIAITRSQAVAQAAAASSSSALSLSQIRAAEATSLMAKAQRLLNTTLLANPYALIAAALAAVVTSYFVLREETVKIKTAQELLAEASKSTTASFAQQKTEINGLINVLKNQNIAESERLKAYNRLNEVSPEVINGLDFQKAKTADLTKALNEYLVSLRQKLRLETNQGALKEAYDQDTKAANALAEAQSDLVTKRKEYDKLPASVKAITGGGTVAEKAFTDAQKVADKAAEAKLKAERTVSDIENIRARIYTGGGKEFIQSEITRLETFMAATTDKQGVAYKKAEDQVRGYREELTKVAASEKAGQAIKARGLQQIDKEIKAQRELLDTNLSEAKRAEINQKIASLQTERANLQGKRTPAQNKAAKEAEKIGDAGSQSYWENEAKLAEDALKRIDASANTSQVNRLKATKEFATQQAELIQRSLDTPVGTLKYYESLIDEAQKAIDALPDKADPAQIATQQYIITQATEKADEIRKRNAVKTFAEELDEKKRQYELYQRWVDAYGKEAADAQFADLKRSGDTYVDYLNSKINELEAKKTTGPLTEKEAINLDNLTVQRNELTGIKKPIELFTEALERAKVEAANLTEYLDKLRDIQSKLGPADYDKKKIVSERIVSTTYERDDSVKQYLQSVVASEEQITAIRKKYADQRAGLSKQVAAGIAVDYAASLSQIGQDEQKEIDEAKLRRLQDSKEWVALTDKITAEGRRGENEKIDQLQGRLAKLKDAGLEGVKEYREILIELNGLKKDKANRPLEDFKLFAGLAGELGQALAGVNGGLGETGQLLAGLASQAGLVASAFKKGVSPQEQIAVGIQGAISLVNILTSSANERRKAEEEYYRSTNAFQQQKNLLLNDEAVIKAKASQNVFTRDYDRDLKANMAKYTDASKKYQESIAKLNQAQVKVGQRDAVSWANVGSAAAAGAALGTIVPGVGNLVGGIVGGIAGALTGLFAAKKKEDVFGGLLQTYPELIQQSTDGVQTLNTALAQSLVQSGLLNDSSKQLVSSALEWQQAISDAKEAIKSIVGELAGSLGSKLQDSLVSAFRAGESAAASFGEATASVIEDLVTKMLFSKTFGPAFDKLQAELSESLTTGDGNTLDDFTRFSSDAKALTEQYNKQLAQFQTAAKDAGFDVLKNPNAEKAKGLSGAIKGIEESTANVLAGELTAMRITNASIDKRIGDSLLFLSGIQQNTGNIDLNTATANGKLDKIIDALNKDSLRAKGLPG